MNIQQLLLQRKAWALMSVGAWCLLAIALFFQYVLLLNPCVMCVYQRVAVLGIALFTLIGALFKQAWLRVFAGFGWLATACWGFDLATELNRIQTNPSPFSTCEFFPNYPTWLPLDQWLPSVFMPTGMCSDDLWQLFGLSMTQWMMVIFSGFILLGMVFLIITLKNKVNVIDQQR